MRRSCFLPEKRRSLGDAAGKRGKSNAVGAEDEQSAKCAVEIVSSGLIYC